MKNKYKRRQQRELKKQAQHAINFELAKSLHRENETEKTVSSMVFFNLLLLLIVFGLIVDKFNGIDYIRGLF